MKKLIVSVLLIATIFNLIQPISLATTENATENAAENATESANSITPSDLFNSLIYSDTRDVGGTAVKLVFSPLGGAATSNALVNMGNGLACTISFALAGVAGEGGLFTIYDVVFNEFGVFDANYLLDNKENTNDTHKEIKEQVSIWYNIIRRIAIALSLCILIYIGIRMAISTLSEEKAKYKEMFIAWVQSFILIFVLHYIILISMVVSSAIFNIIKTAMSGVATNIGGARLTEYGITLNALFDGITKVGWDSVPMSLLYWVLVFYQVKFFMLYAKRALSVAFLIIIAPLITVTYPIDKAGDGKAQAFGTWLKEFEVNMFIQPLHALLYFVFVVSAFEIAERAPLLAVIFFIALSRGEKVVKGILDARGMKSINSMGKTKKKK